MYWNTWAGKIKKDDEELARAQEEAEAVERAKCTREGRKYKPLSPSKSTPDPRSRAFYISPVKLNVKKKKQRTIRPHTALVRPLKKSPSSMPSITKTSPQKSPTTYLNRNKTKTKTKQAIRPKTALLTSTNNLSRSASTRSIGPTGQNARRNRPKTGSLSRSKNSNSLSTLHTYASLTSQFTQAGDEEESANHDDSTRPLRIWVSEEEQDFVTTAWNHFWDKLETKLQRNPSLVNSRGTDGWTALHAAAYHGEVGVVEKLLDGKADIHTKGPNGWTALHWVVKKHDMVTTTYLLQCFDPKHPNHQTTLGGHGGGDGSDGRMPSHIGSGRGVDAVDILGRSPLHYAAHEGYEDLVRLLCDAGADTALFDASGRTALGHARDERHHEIQEFLLTWSRARRITGRVDSNISHIIREREHEQRLRRKHQHHQQQQLLQQQLQLQQKASHSKRSMHDPHSHGFSVSAASAPGLDPSRLSRRALHQLNHFGGNFGNLGNLGDQISLSARSTRQSGSSSPSPRPLNTINHCITVNTGKRGSDLEALEDMHVSPDHHHEHEHEHGSPDHQDTSRDVMLLISRLGEVQSSISQAPITNKYTKPYKTSTASSRSRIKNNDEISVIGTSMSLYNNSPSPNYNSPSSKFKSDKTVDRDSHIYKTDRFQTLPVATSSSRATKALSNYNNWLNRS